LDRFSVAARAKMALDPATKDLKDVVFGTFGSMKSNCYEVRKQKSDNR
jgi:hypothetical protein